MLYRVYMLGAIANGRLASFIPFQSLEASHDSSHSGLMFRRMAFPVRHYDPLKGIGGFFGDRTCKGQ
jgi:hypothetical protein